MGCYINPTDKTKEEWLKENAEQHMHGCVPSFYDSVIQRKLPVVLLDNGPFTAAGVCCSQAEFDAFTRPTDYRQKWYFTAPISALMEVCGDTFKQFAEREFKQHLS